MKPLISVCIANYNGTGLIDACITSVRNQDCDFPVEIIVHDDASTDGSAEHIRAAHPDVHLIESADNVGFCVSNNRMAAAAHGEHLLLLNNDAELLPDALQTLLTASEEIGRPAILTLPQFDHGTGELIDRGCLLDPFFNPVPNLDPARQDVAMVIGACLWIPRALWVELGGFPEWFGSIGEDLYMCCRARLMGHPIRVCTAAGYRHRVGSSFGGGKVTGGRLSTTARRRALSERNKTFTMIVCQPPALLLASLPLHLILIHIEGLAVSLIRRDAMLWRAIYAPLMKDVWKHRGRLRATRRVAQSTRKAMLTDWLGAFRWIPWKLQMLLRHGIPEVK